MPLEKNDTLILRGGLMERAPLRESLEAGLEADGFYNLSFWGDDSLGTVDEVTKESFVPQGKVRVTRLGTLKALGYDPYPSDPWPHITVRFGAEPTDIELDALVGAFGAPIPNPNQ